MESRSGKINFFIVFFISFSAFTFELLLTRIFSVLMWYHFASLSIGVAMLGLGGGGVLSYFLRNRLDWRLINRAIYLYIIAFLIIHGFFFYFHSYPEKITPFLSFFHQPYFQPFQRGVFFAFNLSTFLLILISYLIITTPFFIAGFIISSIFKINYRDTKRLYYFDLAGAGIASLFVAIILNFLSPLSVFSVIALLGLIILFFMNKNKILTISLLILAVAFIFSSIVLKKDEILIARGKVAKDIIWSKWNTFSRVILYNLKREEWSNPFGQSKYYEGYVPRQWGLLVDDTGYTVVSEVSEDDEKIDFFRWNIISLPYLLNNKSALIIGPGGGKDVLCALSMGVKKENITAVELNPLVVHAVNNVLRDETKGLYNQVNTYISEGRSFLEKGRGEKRYDVIQATSVYGRIPPAAGIFTFAEDNLYTKEAFLTYFSSLKDNGLLSLSRFIYEQAVPKMVVLSIEALKDFGINTPERSLFIGKERGLAMVLAKKGFFTKDEIDRLIRYCDEKGFDVLYAPYYSYENIYSEMISKGYKNITLPTDDKPFYYYNLSKKDFLKSLFSQNDKFEERGIEILKIFIMISILFVFLILFMPLIIEGKKRKKEGGSPAPLLTGMFFFFIGVGYIFIEIIFIKSFSLFLETPMYSMIFVTAAMLFASALGSLFSKRIKTSSSMIKFFMALILLLFLVGFMNKAFNNFLYLPLPIKIIITLLFVGSVGFLMGMPFPYLLTIVANRDDGLVPWAIAVNSGASVLGSFLCLISVVNLGFMGSFYIGGLLYFSAFLVFLFWSRRYEKIF